MLSSRQDLIVGVQTISSKTADGKDVILSPNGGILATIDTGTDEIWLPRAMCDMFASTFNLTYFDEADRYIVTDAAHSELLRTKPSVTFRLGNGISGGEAIDIELPYDAFDLVGTYPLFGKPTNYFPLRRAQNSTQYALGRTFLQEAYLSVDFERDTFNLSQATFTAQAVPADVVTIEPKDKSVDNLTKLGSTSNNSKLSHGAIVGIAIGAVFLLFVVLGSWLYRRRKRAKKYAGAAQELPDNEKAEPNQSELANCEKTEVNPFELDAIVEAPGTLSLTAELEHRGIVELYSPHGASEVDDVEKFGSHIIGTTKEVPPSPVYELPSPDMDKFVKRG